MHRMLTWYRFLIYFISCWSNINIIMHRFYCYLRLSASYRRMTVPVKLLKYSLLLNFARTDYLLTEWEGRTGKYLALGQDENQIFSSPARPHSVKKHFIVWPLFIFSFSLFLVKRGHVRGSIASFRAHFQRTNKQRCELVIAAIRRPTVHRDNITVRMFAFTRFQENTL